MSESLGGGCSCAWAFDAANATAKAATAAGLEKKRSHVECLRVLRVLVMTAVYSAVYGIRDAVYATIFIMSSVVKLATTGFINSVQVPLRKPCCMSNICRIK